MAVEYIEDLLVESSKEVLRECALPNGAIVAANSTLPEYPYTAENYFFSWGRDAAYQLVAAHRARMPDASRIRQGYMAWLTERCMDFKVDETIIKRSNPNGSPDHRYGDDYQPDQAGALLWALHETAPDPDRQTDVVVRSLANGLTRSWSGRHFDRPVQDLWENTLAEPTRHENFTYTLALCIHGLSAAIDRLAHQGFEGQRSEWLEVRNTMLDALLAEHRPYFRKKVSVVGSPHNSLDASLLGLIYPFEAPLDSRFGKQRIATIQAIGQHLCDPVDGIQRYPGDTYDGIVRPGGGEATAGRWPLLTYWYAIALQRIGDHQAARAIIRRQNEGLSELYNEGSLTPGHIPEQIYPDGERQGKGVTPLGWSHAKFLIAMAEITP